MRILRADIAAFGHLNGLSLDLDHPVVTLLGPNEAGKSTLFHFFQSMLYGFYPANRDAHPYVPWGASAAEGSIAFRTNGGSEITVHRRLMSAPSAKLIAGDAIQDIRNQTLPQLGHIDRNVFAAVYALTLQEMAAIEEGAWGEVQDRLLGGMNVDYVRPARIVVGALEEEAKALWKEDRRGKPRARELTEKQRALKKLRSEAAERDRSIREMNRTIEEKVARLQEAKEALIQLEAQQRRANKIQPVQQRLGQIRVKEALAGDLSDLQNLPADPAIWLEERERELASLRDETQRLKERLASLRRIQEDVTDADRRLLDHEAVLTELLAERVPYIDRMNRRQEREQELRTSRELLLAEADRVLVRWDEDVAEALQQLSMPELNQRVQRLQQAERSLSDLAARIDAALDNQKAPPPLAPRLITLAGGLILIVVGWLLGVDLFALAGVALAAFAGSQVYQAWSAARQPSATGALEAKHQAAQAELEARQAELADLLQTIPLPESRIAQPDLQLAGDLTGLRQYVLQVRKAEEALRSLDERIAQDAERAVRVAGEAGLPIDGDGDFLDVLQRVASALEPARSRAQHAAQAARDQEEVEANLQRMEEALEARAREHQAVVDRVVAIGEGDLHVGLQSVADRRQAQSTATALWETLEKEYPDWQSIEQEARGVPEALWSDEDLTRAEHELRALRQEQSDLDGDLKQHRAELRHLSEGRSVDQIDSEMAWLEAELQDVQRRRDRLQLLANVLRKADVQYREQHQPDVLRRAGAYLKAFTGGRYDRLVMDETEDTLLVLPPGQLAPTGVDAPLSQGTRDQIYLALRLAIADHLDEGRTRVPLFLDETFVNWDATRRSKALEILREMSVHRQIFVFTCHPWFAEELQARTGSAVVDLAREAVTA